MTITERLLSSVQEIWAGYPTHPFVMGIGDGSLDQACGGNHADLYRIRPDIGEDAVNLQL